MPPKDILLDLFPSFKDTDPDATHLKIGVTSASCLVSLVIFITTYISSRPLREFQRLSPSQKVFWSATVVRGLFGFWSILFGVWYLLFDDNLHIDIIQEYDFTSHFICYINLGFFIFEFSCLVLSNLWFRHFDKALFTHHLLGLGMFFCVVYYDIAHYVGIVGALLEMTTPFSCICWLLLKLKKQNTKLWSINQLVLIHLFHCRSMMEAFWWWQTYKHWDSIINHLPLVLILDVYVGLIATTFVLTPYWTIKKTEQYFNRQDWNHPGNQRETQLNGGGTIPNGDAVTNGNVPSHHAEKVVNNPIAESSEPPSNMQRNKSKRRNRKNKKDM